MVHFSDSNLGAEYFCLISTKIQVCECWPKPCIHVDFPQIQALVLHKKQTITSPQKPWTRPFERLHSNEMKQKRPNPNMLWQFSNLHPPWDSPEFTLILIFINGLGSQAHFQFLTEDKFYQGSIWSSHLGTGGQYWRALLLAGITSGWIGLKAFWYTVYSSNVVWCDEWLIWEGDCVHSDRPTVKPTTGVTAYRSIYFVFVKHTM